MARIRQKARNRTESRRQEVKRQLSERRAGSLLKRRVLARIHPGSALIWVGFYVANLVILLVGGAAMPWHLNERLTRDIIARVPFAVEDPVRTEQERQVAESLAPDIFVQNVRLPILIRSRLTEALTMAKAADNDPKKLTEQLAAKGWKIDPEAAQALLEFASNSGKSTAFERLVNRLVDELSRVKLVDKPDPKVRSGTPRTSILRPSEEGKGRDIEVLTSQLKYVNDTKAVHRIARDLAARIFPEPLQQAVAELVAATILGSAPAQADGSGSSGGGPNPVWRYDAAATQECMKQARESVPKYWIRYEKGDVVVRAAPDAQLSSGELALLRREHQAYQEATQTDPELWRKKILAQAGTAIILILVTVGLAVYTASYQPRVLQKPARTFGLAVLLTLMVLCSRLTVRVPEFSVGLVVIAAMLLTIAYNQRFAFGVVGVLAILVILATGGDFGLFLVLLATGATAVFWLREVRSRSKVIAVGMGAAATALLTSVAVGLVQGQYLKYVFEHSAAATGATIFAGFIVQGILPHFEKFFGIATSMTLLEWCDASRPLLRLLAQQAPGTYSHSLILSQMCDDAAEAIGANGLLARVGALYHDIGKITKPDYFVENQEARLSRHDRLSPTMSLLIITGHVKDGLELARAYGLPRILHQFILEHHGTTVVRYFHHVASEAAAKKTTGKHDREVSESEFRYPGPKPRSRESAILMLCDSCEGAVRALEEPTAGRIESTVHQVVMDRLSDGQFDDCDITLRELRLVELSIVKSLAAFHHGRVKYPKGRGAASREEPSPQAKASGEAGTEQPREQTVAPDSSTSVGAGTPTDGPEESAPDPEASGPSRGTESTTSEVTR